MLSILLYTVFRESNLSLMQVISIPELFFAFFFTSYRVFRVIGAL